MNDAEQKDVLDVNGMPGRQKIENHREPKHKYSIETKRRGIVTSRNCALAEL